ncbi:MAG: NUDIX domain-containing protein [Rickettsiales bacterium]|jgi:8-oxo-dGTP pyrophosphatase MutT (NUDIX family)|nr:NUDIX domain-containing protein [Rickettsiales bacterium]
MNLEKTSAPAPQVRHIRPIVVASIKNPDGRYFMVQFTDRIKNRKFYRMSGGGIEFGEEAAEALKREFLEEYGLDIIVGDRLDVKENIFTYGESIGHEVVFIYDAAFSDKSVYSADKIPNIEDEQHKDEFGLWVDISKMNRERMIYYEK